MAWPKKSSHNCGSCNGSCTSVTLNAALVATASNQEVAIVTPILIPAVLDLPVLLAIKLTVTNQGDGMTSKELGSCVLVDTRLVCWEIAVDSERHVHGTVLNQVLHHGLLASVAVGGGGMQLVLGERL